MPCNSLLYTYRYDSRGAKETLIPNWLRSLQVLASVHMNSFIP